MPTTPSLNPGAAVKTVEWIDGALRLIDQTRLPDELVGVTCLTCADVCAAISTMQVRGAPAIGVTAAFGVALGVRDAATTTADEARSAARACGERLRATRPTAVNLAWAVARVLRSADSAETADDVLAAMISESQQISDEDEAMCRAIGSHGAELVPEGARILTHCNAGGLATVSYGTALGVIRAAHSAGRGIHVYVDETRPLLQGARLTAWELGQEGIPYTLITDNMAGHLMRLGRIDLAIVGADRIAANGDVANKIGTYSVAVIARHHGLPMYVAAPTSTVDLSLANGDQIPIEERRPDEVLEVRGRRLAPADAVVANPAFDVTPQELVSAIITEHGVIRPPFAPGLSEAVGAARALRHNQQRK
jgi:methylthioribose-1-phosphate isomerase